MKVVSKISSKVNATKALVASAIITGVSTVLKSAGFCEVDASSSVQNAMKMLFNALMIVGIIVAVAGVAKTFMAIKDIVSGNENATGSGVAMGVVMIIGGIIIAALKPIITALTGTDPTGISLY